MLVKSATEGYRSCKRADSVRALVLVGAAEAQSSDRNWPAVLSGLCCRGCKGQACAVGAVRGCRAHLLILGADEHAGHAHQLQAAPGHILQAQKDSLSGGPLVRTGLQTSTSSGAPLQRRGSDREAR